MGKKIWSSVEKTLESVRKNIVTEAQKLMTLGKKVWSNLIKALSSIKASITTATQKSKIKIGSLLAGIAAICTILGYFGYNPANTTDTANVIPTIDNSSSESSPGNQYDDNLSNYSQPSPIITPSQSTDMDNDGKSDDGDVDNNDYNEIPVDIEEENEIKSTVSNVTNVISTPSDEIVKNYQEFILQQKSKYTDSDIINIENTFVSFYVWEKAAEVSYICEETGQMISDSIGGKFISSATIIIVDYETDEVIYTLISDEDGYARYHPAVMRLFYCVVVTFDYQMFVSPPVHLIDNGHSQPNGVELFLDKPYSIYSQSFQIQLKMRDSSGTYVNYSFWPSRIATVRCIDVECEDYESFISTTYGYSTNGFGIISMGENPCYFSLNLQYVFNVSLASFNMSYEIIDSSLKNTDIVEIYLVYAGKLPQQYEE